MTSVGTFPMYNLEYSKFDAFIISLHFEHYCVGVLGYPKIEVNLKWESIKCTITACWMHIVVFNSLFELLFFLIRFSIISDE